MNERGSRPDAAGGARISFRPAGAPAAPPRPAAPAEAPTAGAPPPGPPRAARAAEARRRGHAALLAGRLDEGLEALREAVRLEPGSAGAWTNLGAILRKRGEHALAVEAQRRAHALAPEDLAILGNLGNALQDADLLEEALEIRREVARRAPERPEARSLLSVTLRSLGRLDEAIAAAEAGLALAPDHPELTVQRAVSRLAKGDWEGGLADYVRRWEIGEIDKPPLSDPEWEGEPLAGRRILVLPEQGHGDTVLMARFLPLLKATGAAETILAVKAPLARLLGRPEGVDRVVRAGAPKPRADFVVHMVDLPRLLPFDPAAPPPAPRLVIPADSRARARAIVAPFDGRLKVGVVWSGSVDYKANFKRSFGPDRFQPLLGIPGVQLFSLYKGPLLQEFRASGLSALIVDAGGDDRDFADAAALAQEMDLVIGVDTGVMHVAASLGRPVWNLLAFSPYWLYGLAEEGTPWHPTMRLFRQARPSDWSAPLARVEAELAALAAARGAEAGA